MTTDPANAAASAASCSVRFTAKSWPASTASPTAKSSAMKTMATKRIAWPPSPSGPIQARALVIAG